MGSALRIDAHQHFWHYKPEEFPWIQEQDSCLACNFLPADLYPSLAAARMERCIAVQARSLAEETDFLLGLANAFSWITGVIGWVELREGDALRAMERWEGQSKLLGMRHILQDEPDPSIYLESTIFRENIEVLQRKGLVYELLLRAGQLQGVAEFCTRIDRHYLVLDHIGKPSIYARSKEAFQAWRSEIRRIAENKHVFCKVSGLVTEARYLNGHLDGFEPADFYPYLDVCFEHFGAERLIFGSDWPVCRLAQSYSEVAALMEGWTKTLSADEYEAFWGGNAQRCYGIKSI